MPCRVQVLRFAQDGNTRFRMEPSSPPTRLAHAPSKSTPRSRVKKSTRFGARRMPADYQIFNAVLGQ